MDESVDGGQCHCRVWEDCVPFPEGLVGGDEHRSSLVSRADEFEQNACFSLVLGNVSDVIKDEQLEFIELSNGAFKQEIAPRLLQLLNQVSGSCKEHAVSLLNKGQADCGAEMRFADAGWAEQQNVASPIDPAVASGDGADMRFGQHGDGCEVEVLKGFSGH